MPTLLDGLGAHPIRVGDLPPQCAAVNRSYIGPAELAVRAAVDGDPRLVRAAAMVDPNAAASLTVDQIWQLCDAMVDRARSAASGGAPPSPCPSDRERSVSRAHLTLDDARPCPY